ncbi:hypothetical protein IPH92_01180 [Candidatus Kaiserbacteria bacterium]|nr:MAG: hypothetical protein IPH92_01180 [Candidatus Kaiserbacteria bacterium]
MANSLTPVDVDFFASFAEAAGSPSLSLHHRIEEMKSGTLTVAKFIYVIEDLVCELDESHNASVTSSPYDAEVREMASKWSHSAPEIFDFLESVKALNKQGDVTEDHLGMLAIIYDLLNKRMQTFIQEGQPA